MFRKFKEIFSSDSLLDAAYDETVTMLEYDHKMFLDSCKALRESENAELPYDFKEADRKINKFEREVRRKVLAHLAVGQPLDIAPSLTLITVVVDVERIGDYTKNIADLARQRQEKLRAGEFENRLTEIEIYVKNQFPAVMELFQEKDSEEASQTLAEEPQWATKAEEIVSDLITGKGSGLTSETQVSLALYARYLKRVNAHLTNIASAVVNPFPRIGFREKKKA